jgi:spermidine synthase
MMAWMLLRPAAELARGHAVQLGLGAGAITRFTQGVMKMKTTVVEMNPTVIGVNRPSSACRPKAHASRCWRWMRSTTSTRSPSPASVDVLCVDLYDHEAAAPVLDSEASTAGCRARCWPTAA